MIWYTMVQCYKTVCQCSELSWILMMENYLVGLVLYDLFVKVYNKNINTILSVLSLFKNTSTK